MTSSRKTQIIMQLNKKLQTAKAGGKWFFTSSPVVWPFGVNPETLLEAEIKESKLTPLSYYHKAEGVDALIHLLNEVTAGKSLPVKINDGSIPASVGTIVGSVESKESRENKEDNQGENLLGMIDRIREKLVQRHQQVEKDKDFNLLISESLADTAETAVKAGKAVSILDALGVFVSTPSISRPSRSSVSAFGEFYPFGLTGKDENELRSLISHLGLSWTAASTTPIKEFVALFDAATATKKSSFNLRA